MPYGAATRPKLAAGSGRNRTSPRTNCSDPSIFDRRSRFPALASMEAERSRPTTRAPALATGMATRPVPHPSSRTGPAAFAARRCQNRTSRRPIVWAFSQS